MMAVIDGEVQRILDEGRNMAYLVLSEHYEQITHLVAVLMEQEQLDRAQFEAVIEGSPFQFRPFVRSAPSAG